MTHEPMQLVHQLMPQLLSGTHPVLDVLRRQYESAKIQIQAAGKNWGFYADFEISEDVPVVAFERLVGGSAEIELEGETFPSGCVLYVVGGKLKMLEVYSADRWPDKPAFLGVRNVEPLVVPDGA